MPSFSECFRAQENHGRFLIFEKSCTYDTAYCVISPTLFLIMINAVLDYIHEISPHMKCSLYADDIAVWFSHPSVDRANQFIQLALDHIYLWCSRWGLKVSPAKSATLIFSNQLAHLHPLNPLKINGENIPIVNTFKYLGVTLDRRLTFTPHIADLKQRCSRRLNIMKCISGREWGADRRTLLHLYTSLIRPILDYNAFLFDHISDTNKASLEAIQNEALRIATGALRTTPVCNLTAETNIPPLTHRRKYLLLRFFLRSQSRPNQPTYLCLSNFPRNNVLSIQQRKHPSIATQIQRTWDLFNQTEIPVFSAPPLRCFWKDVSPDIHFLFDCPKKGMIMADVQAKFAEFKHNHSDFTFIYTDGSRREGRTGAAFTLNDINVSRRLSDHHSVYTAELIAIYSAVGHIKQRQIFRSVICTDSISSLHAIAAIHNSSHPIVYKIRLLLSSLPENIVIKFLWIPGHAGIRGNESADKLAKQSLLLPFANQLKCPLSDVLNVLHGNFLSFLQNEWNLIAHHHLHHIKPILGHWSSSQQNTRLKEIILARLRLGNTKLTHSHIFDGKPPSSCHRCNILYTTKHFLLQCPLYNVQRRKIIRHVTANRLPLTLHSLLGDSSPDLLDLLFEFLHNTKLENFI